MARLTLSILTTLLIYVAYQALACEALSASDGSSSNSRGSQSTRNSETVENLLNQDDALSKLQNVWFKNAYNRRSPASTGRIGTYTVLRRSPSAGVGNYLADLNFVDDEDVEKRFDDYGHMRFGKRGGEGDQFDDYGHMRFGRR